MHSFINVTFHASFPLNQVPRFCSSANNCEEYSQKAATCTLLHFSILDSFPFRISVVVHKLQNAASAPIRCAFHAIMYIMINIALHMYGRIVLSFINRLDLILDISPKRH